ncbi:MAG: hypothetical protein JXL97_07890 [Bacteroidales bacterium]|nr:hypothetical protein [Bacteroidales bacterium]
MNLPEDIKNLADLAVYDQSKFWDLWIELNKLEEKTAISTCIYIIKNYNSHDNFFIAVELTDFLIKKEAYNCLDEMIFLRKESKTRKVIGSSRRKLDMNIEIMEIYANTDIDFFKCTCQVYSFYLANPKSCKDIEILSERNPSDGYVEMNEIKAKCTRCGTPWKITEESYSSTGTKIKWEYDGAG